MAMSQWMEHFSKTDETKRPSGLLEKICVKSATWFLKALSFMSLTGY
jgi:hypothetical protein